MEVPKVHPFFARVCRKGPEGGEKAQGLPENSRKLSTRLISADEAEPVVNISTSLAPRAGFEA
jgi:hypothetical protein